MRGVITWLLENGKRATVTTVDYPPITLRGRVEGYRDEVRWANDGRCLGFFSVIHGERLPLPNDTFYADWGLVRLADGGPLVTGR